MRLRKRAAFDRFLSRVFKDEPKTWRLKGGYALEVRLGGKARATNDVDLSTSLESEEELARKLDAMAGSELGDYFKFSVQRKESRGGGQPGSVRFSVDATIGGKTFEKFSLDVVLGEPEILEPDYRPEITDMSFAGIPKSELTLYSLGEHFAEKFHAYTRPYENPSRVKDLVDMTLMVETLDGLPTPEDMRSVLEKIFDRDSTHAFPSEQEFSYPPAGWEQPFKSHAEELGLRITDFKEAHRVIVRYVYGASSDSKGD